MCRAQEEITKGFNSAKLGVCRRFFCAVFLTKNIRYDSVYCLFTNYRTRLLNPTAMYWDKVMSREWTNALIYPTVDPIMKVNKYNIKVKQVFIFLKMLHTFCPLKSISRKKVHDKKKPHHFTIHITPLFSSYSAVRKRKWRQHQNHNLSETTHMYTYLEADILEKA